LSKGVPSLGSDLSALFTVVVPAGAAAAAAADDNGSSSSSSAAAAATTRVLMATDPVDLVDHPVLTAISELCDTYIAALRYVACLRYTLIHTISLNVSHVASKRGLCCAVTTTAVHSFGPLKQSS
jgi:hypothetical protein